MARYKRAVITVCISAREDEEAAAIVAQCNELASLVDDKTTRVVKHILREVLPKRIAQAKRSVK